MNKQLQDFNLGFSLARDISESQDYHKLIEVLENWDFVHDMLKPIFIDLIESFGFYPYLNDEKLSNLNLSAKYRNEFHKSNISIGRDEKIRFHSEQKRIEEIISKKQNVILSAPTSFGKSLLIEEFISRKIYKNIIIIQPTLALIDETRKKLRKYADYNIVVNTKQELGENNIFILTSERVLELLPNISGIEIDFFVIDEFYKISNSKSDERVSQLNIAFYKIMQINSPQLLLLTPNVDDISSGFLNKYDIKFITTAYSLVNQNITHIEYSGKDSDKKEKLFELLKLIPEQTIVYVRSPKRAEELALEYITRIAKTEVELPIIQWIDENISREWNLKTILNHGIGIHNGQFPRHIVNSQLDYFNQGKLNVIFATTSLIEGVNTSAKNIVIFDMKKSNKSLSYFDFNNIKGRAGRMMQHYSGNIFYFDTPPVKTLEKVDIPLIEQRDNLQSEVLVNLERTDVKDNLKEKYNTIKSSISEELWIIFRGNYYDVESQKRLYNYLVQNPNLLKDLSWNSISPSYDILLQTMKAISYGLDNSSNNSYKYIALRANKISKGNIKDVIDSEVQYQLDKAGYEDLHKTYNKAIFDIFKFVRTEAKFKIPKKMLVLQSIVNYILKDKKADYSSFIAKLENEGVGGVKSVLLDYGVPSTAIKKIRTNLDSTELIDYIKSNIDSLNFTDYEREIIEKL
ncbi:DEAD/DEAH box helicase [Streptococcus sinensis]|uniref:DEAD/DEAH box helicase n=1 Tax=Streptococcus sinensis TaxID=176090 RepID=UPI00272C7BAD|nr:DEAD/DEAH box helicase [Streptococcus sinensis]